MLCFHAAPRIRNEIALSVGSGSPEEITTRRAGKRLVSNNSLADPVDLVGSARYVLDRSVQELSNTSYSKVRFRYRSQFEPPVSWKKRPPISVFGKFVVNLINSIGHIRYGLNSGPGSGANGGICEMPTYNLPKVADYYYPGSLSLNYKAIFRYMGRVNQNIVSRVQLS